MSPRPCALLLLCACQSFELRSSNDIGAITLFPSFVTLAPVQPGATATFDVTLRGRDTLRGMQWLPGFGSKLLVATNEIGLYATDPEADPSVEPSFQVSYTLRDEIGVADDTAVPIDDGILRFFFQQQEPVDLWAEVDHSLPIAPTDPARNDPDAPAETAP